jgi:hypothetical protein
VIRGESINTPTSAIIDRWNGFRVPGQKKAALALHFAHYNFCRIHGSLRITPAMAAGITDHVWTLDELIAV